MGAKEIATEFIDDNNGDGGGDVMQDLMKNPSKLFSLTKKIGDKLDSKMKNGELNESELMSEVGNMMSNMNNIPGMDNFKHLFKAFEKQADQPTKQTDDNRRKKDTVSRLQKKIENKNTMRITGVGQNKVCSVGNNKPVKSDKRHK